MSEKAMAPHSSILAWKIPWMEEPGRLQSMGWLRVRHDWATSLSLFTFMHWRRKWQPTPVFLPGESQGRGSLVGCHLWGRRVGHNWSDLAAAAKYVMLNTQIKEFWLHMPPCNHHGVQNPEYFHLFGKFSEPPPALVYCFLSLYPNFACFRTWCKWKQKVKVKAAQSCLTLCDPID